VHLVYLGELEVEDGVRADVRIRRIVGPELSHRVHCAGRVDRQVVLASMAAARVFAFPSRLETLGLVVGEAMLSRVPVITSNCEPFPEYLTHEETGLLVPPDDAPALAAAVCRLLASPALGLKLANAAHRLAATKFALETCVASSEEFYRGSLDGDLERFTALAASRPLDS
jgi:glycosyltransferase involved in cell wall biosynthesis